MRLTSLLEERAYTYIQKLGGRAWAHPTRGALPTTALSLPLLALYLGFIALVGWPAKRHASNYFHISTIASNFWVF